MSFKDRIINYLSYPPLDFTLVEWLAMLGIVIFLIFRFA